MTINKSPTAQGAKHIPFKKWLTTPIVFRFFSHSREIILFPKYVLLGLFGLRYALDYLGKEDLVFVFIEGAIVFLLGGGLWYWFDRVRGKTKII